MRLLTGLLNSFVPPGTTPSAPEAAKPEPAPAREAPQARATPKPASPPRVAIDIFADPQAAAEYARDRFSEMHRAQALRAYEAVRDKS